MIINSDAQYKAAHDQFYNWVDTAKKSNHLTGDNAYHIKKAFDKAIENASSQDRSLSNLTHAIDKMKKYFPTPEETKQHVISEAVKAFSLLAAKASSTSHDAKVWLKEYQKHEKDRGAQKKMRAHIFAQTQKACKEGYMLNGKPVTIPADVTLKMQQGTLVIHKPKPQAAASISKTPVVVYKDDSITCTRKLQKKGLYPCVLNMANAAHPGGGVINGASAQEESIFRVSNAFQSAFPTENAFLAKQLAKGGYDIPEFGVIYNPQVTIIREPIDAGFAFCEPFQVDMISAAAYDLQKNEKMSMGYEKGTKEKIRAILRVAKGTGHDSVVLGAIGCGAFANDPKIVSNLFATVFQEKEFQGQFKEVAFAIIDDQNSNGNLATFSKTFKNFAF